MPRLIADLSVGHSAVGSVADTMSAFAPLEIAAWIAGICEDEVADVPLVSVPVSPRALSAEIAPPELALSAVVKYELPRFFGMTKTLRPVLRPLAAAAPDEPAPDAAGLDAAEDAAELAGAAGLEELEELELQAASAIVAVMGSASASFLARLRVITLYPFNFCGGYFSVRDAWLCADYRVVCGLPGCVRDQGCDRRRSQRPAMGRKKIGRAHV